MYFNANCNWRTAVRFEVIWPNAASVK